MTSETIHRKKANHALHYTLGQAISTIQNPVDLQRIKAVDLQPSQCRTLLKDDRQQSDCATPMLCAMLYIPRLSEGF